MSVTKPSTRPDVDRGSRRAGFLAATVLLAVGGLVTAALALPPNGSYDLVVTPAAVAYQQAGYCDTTSGTPTCKEWCITTLEGYVLPQGQFVCVDE